MDLIASLPPDLAADRPSWPGPSWPGPAVPRVTRKVTFTSLTRAQRADVARLYAIGVPVRDICARFNITKNTVIRLRKQAGVPQRQRGLDDPQGHETEAMYASGTSLKAIAERIGVGVGAVRGCLLRRGVKMRKKNGAR
jgi:hypothetical protein